MSQIPTDNDDNRSVAASDFVQLDQPDEMPDQQEEQPQQQGQPQLGLHQSFWALDTGSTHNNYENVLKEQKLMIEKLEANIQTLQEKVKNLELEAKIRTMEENAEHKANYQALEAKMNEVVQMLSTQNEEHRKEMEQLKDGFAKEMEQLKSKNRKLEEKLMSNVEVPTTKNGALDAKMEQLQDEFSKKLVEQQKQMMEHKHIQAQSHFLEQKLKEAEQRAQTGKNELEEIIEHKMENFREEMEAVFFTLNGILLEKQIQINPTVDRLYPTMSIRRVSAEANFGDNLVAKPFKFDVDSYPGLVFE